MDALVLKEIDLCCNGLYVVVGIWRILYLLLVPLGSVENRGIGGLESLTSIIFLILTVLNGMVNLTFLPLS